MAVRSAGFVRTCLLWPPPPALSFAAAEVEQLPRRRLPGSSACAVEDDASPRPMAACWGRPASSSVAAPRSSLSMTMGSAWLAPRAEVGIEKIRFTFLVGDSYGRQCEEKSSPVHTHSHTHTAHLDCQTHAQLSGPCTSMLRLAAARLALGCALYPPHLHCGVDV